MRSAVALILASLFAFPLEAQQTAPAPEASGVQTKYVKCSVSVHEAKVMDWDSSYAETIVATPKCGDKVEALGTLNGYDRVRTSDGKEGYIGLNRYAAFAASPSNSRTP